MFGYRYIRQGQGPRFVLNNGDIVHWNMGTNFIDTETTLNNKSTFGIGAYIIPHKSQWLDHPISSIAWLLTKNTICWYIYGCILENPFTTVRYDILWLISQIFIKEYITANYGVVMVVLSTRWCGCRTVSHSIAAFCLITYTHKIWICLNLIKNNEYEKAISCETCANFSFRSIHIHLNWFEFDGMNEGILCTTILSGKQWNCRSAS